MGCGGLDPSNFVKSEAMSTYAYHRKRRFDIENSKKKGKAKAKNGMNRVALVKQDNIVVMA